MYMKKKMFILFLIVILVFLFGYICNICRNIEFIEKYNYKWDIYDYNMRKVEDIMNSISKDSEMRRWYYISVDNEYDHAYGEIHYRIRECYLSLEDDGQLYTDTNSLRKYRDSKYVFSDDLFGANDSIKSCLLMFNGLDGLQLSKDEVVDSTIKEKVTEFNNYNELVKCKQCTYEDFLNQEVLLSESLKDLAEWLKYEIN